LKRYLKIISLITLLTVLVGCAYYNTFFNAKKRYNEAFEKQKNVKSDRVPSDIVKGYMAAIKKAFKIIDVYGDSSKYADDALLLIGKAYYNQHDYIKAEHRLNQFLLKYPKSSLIPEAKLWMAKTYIGLEEDEKALNTLNKLFENKVSKKIAAQAFFIRGDLYFQRETYDKALKNLEKCLRIVRDEEMEGNARYMIGQAYFNLGEYENAIFNFDKLLNLNVPVLKEFEARMQIVESLIQLKKYDLAERDLKKMLRSIRFKKQFPLIEAKLGEIYELQGDPQFAVEQYSDVIKKYRRTEGSSLAAYDLARLYEYHFAQLDSAEFYYKKVGAISLQPEILQEAKERANLLKEYLKIRNQLRKDYRDLMKLAAGDSLLEDSVAVQPDSSQQNDAFNKRESEAPEPAINTDMPDNRQQNEFDVRKNANNPPGNIDENMVANEDSSLLQQKRKRTTPKKVAVTRSPEEVQKSFKHNSFALAEYFLLKYMNYDSALVSYKKFINNFNDSLLTPKAYYALYFIYHDIKNDSLKADSIKKVIITSYPKTDYALKLTKQLVEKNEENTRRSIYKDLYTKGEDLLFHKKYRPAIDLFHQIAEEDSGSIWAKKSLYAIAYTYEHMLHDTTQAIQSYTTLTKIYPNSPFARVAEQKIKPPKIKIVKTEIPDSSQVKQKGPEEPDKSEVPHLLDEQKDQLPKPPIRQAKTQKNEPIKPPNKKKKIDF